MDSIYRRCAGPAFDLLPDVVRRSHAVPLTARGEVDVRWSARALARLVARVMRLPPEGMGMPLALEVRADGDRVHYDRRFGDYHLRSVQELERGYLRENAGPGVFLYRLEADAERLVYHTAASRVLGIPLPRWLGARVAATIEPLGEGWTASVVVEMPGLGRICEYEARMRFESGTTSTDRAR
jgi:Domain of unknown function (DUF4166)